MKWIPASLLAGIAVAIYLYVGSLIVPVAWKHDFISFYTGSYFARHGMLASLYDPAALLDFQKTIAPDNPYVIPWSRPRFYTIVLAPLSLLPYKTAYATWLGGQIALLLACWAWFARRFGPDALILAAFFFPAATGIAHGQDAVLVLALAIASYAAFERGQQRLSGVLAGCMLFKFHLVLLLPLAMAMQRRWKMLGGFALMAFSLGTVELLIGGFGGIAGYAHYLTRRDLPAFNPSEELMVNSRSLLMNVGADFAWTRLLLALLALALTVAAFRGTEWWTALAAASLGAVFLVPHAYQYDLTWTLLPLLSIAFLSPRKAPRLAVLPLLTPFPYVLNVAGMPWSGAASLCVLLALVFHALASKKVSVATPYTEPDAIF